MPERGGIGQMGEIFLDFSLRGMLGVGDNGLAISKLSPLKQIWTCKKLLYF